MRYPFELNVDESQMAAQAMRYGHDLTPWRSVDGGKNGPIDAWFLLGVHALGMPYRYTMLHVLSAACLGATLLATYGAARRLAGETPALVGLAAGSWWLAWAPVREFEHYGSELIPILLLSRALVAIVNARQAAVGRDWRQGMVAGVLLGLAPWGTLLAIPMALALGLWAMADGLLEKSVPLPARRRFVLALAAGAIVPSALFLACLVAAGAGGEFWRSYILAGLYHAPREAWQVQREHMRNLALAQPSGPWFWDVALLATGALCLRARGSGHALPRRSLVLALLLLIAGVYSVALRHVEEWNQHELLCLSPLLLCAALAARILLGGASAMRRSAAWTIIGLGVLPLPVLGFIRRGTLDEISQQWHYPLAHASDTQVFMARTVRYYAPQARSLAVWGSNPSLYVDLRIPPAVRNPDIAYLTDGNPSQEFLRAAFMRDLEESEPEAIVDVEDNIVHGQRRSAPEIFPALTDYLAEHYRHAGRGEADGPGETSVVVNVYVRNR